ncbi:alpha/beta hydrolase [Rathayibacter iranicus]|nr:alpha/beta hydrolase [Rathayibacter iranicus]
METFRFDDEVAAQFSRNLVKVADSLRSHAVVHRAAAEQAMQDFKGPFARVFWVAHLTETSNRSRLEAVLFDLSEMVLAAILRARKERERLEEMAAWEARQAEREERRRVDPTGGLGFNPDEFFDRRPSEDRFLPPTLSAAYSPNEPPRTTAAVGMTPAASFGQTSADPDRLDVFVSDARQANVALRAERDELVKAFATFQDACAWVPWESTTALGGFEQLLAIDQSHADWVEQVSLAFTAAGGGLLSTPTLEVVATAGPPKSDQSVLDLLSSVPADELAVLFKTRPELGAQLKRIPATEVNAWWTRLGPAEDGARFSARQEALIGGLPEVIGNLEGVPYGARAQANESVLRARIKALKERQHAMLYGAPDLGADDFAEISKQLKVLENIADSLKVRPGFDERFLISLTDDNPPLAAVSIGDLDTATNVTYAVPGMGQTTATMTSWAKASQNVQSLLPEGSAVVAWIGYETPPPAVENVDPSVLSTADAVAGGAALAASMQGLSAVRGDSIPKPDVVGHSYGTTVIAVAASRSDVELGTFVALGSAGLPDSVDSVSDLHVEGMYAGQARDKYPNEEESGDEAAWIGRRYSFDHHVNPVDPGFGAHAFGVETGGDAGRVVTNHDALRSDDGDSAGYFDIHTEALLNIGRALRGETDLITENKPLGPTEFQKFKKAVIGGEKGVWP